MSQLGLGVMINMLGGNKETVEVLAKAIGRKIKSFSLTKEALHFVMEDGFKFRIFDGGQSCCESRYMTSGDKPEDFIGGKLKTIETAPAPRQPEEYDEHEIQFLRIQTSKGVFVAETHNQHNGYYGGFWIQAQAE